MPPSLRIRWAPPLTRRTLSLSGAGTYQPSSTDVAPGEVTECYRCVSGTYQNTEGQEKCLTCDAGMLSNPTRTACGACEAGQYTKGSACVACPRGTYAPSAQEHACITW